MSKHSTIILLAIITALLPFIGIPTPWKTPLYVVLALVIAFLAFALRQEKKNAEAFTRAAAGGIRPPQSNGQTLSQ